MAPAARARIAFIPYTTNLPIERAIEDDVLLVHTWEGKPLPREHGGPCRMITPKLYAWKSTKWIRRIEFLADDREGFWEVRGYSNTAEPWFNDRYATKPKLQIVTRLTAGARIARPGSAGGLRHPPRPRAQVGSLAKRSRTTETSPSLGRPAQDPEHSDRL